MMVPCHFDLVCFQVGVGEDILQIWHAGEDEDVSP